MPSPTPQVWRRGFRPARLKVQSQHRVVSASKNPNKRLRLDEHRCSRRSANHNPRGQKKYGANLCTGAQHHCSTIAARSQIDQQRMGRTQRSRTPRTGDCNRKWPPAAAPRPGRDRIRSRIRDAAAAPQLLLNRRYLRGDANRSVGALLSDHVINCEPWSIQS